MEKGDDKDSDSLSKIEQGDDRDCESLQKKERGDGKLVIVFNRSR